MNAARPADSRRIAATLVILSLSASLAVGVSDAADDAVAEAAYRSGSEALQRRDYATAIADLERAAAARPRHVETWLKLGVAHGALEHWDQAIEAYRKALEIDPTHAKSQHNLGNVYFRRGDLPAAAAAYGRALELDPHYALAAFHWGWTLRQLGRSEEAERAFRACLDEPVEGPSDERNRADCLFGLGSIRHRAGDYAASASMMEQVLKVYPGHPEARHYLGMAYRQLGRIADAERELGIHEQMLRQHRAAGTMAP